LKLKIKSSLIIFFEKLMINKFQLLPVLTLVTNHTTGLTTKEALTTVGTNGGRMRLARSSDQFTDYR